MNTNSLMRASLETNYKEKKIVTFYYLSKSCLIFL